MSDDVEGFFIFFSREDNKGKKFMLTNYQITPKVEDSTNIKILVFDLGNVLINFDWNRAVNGLKKIDENIDSKLPQIFGSDLMISYEKGVISTEEFYRQLMRMLDMRIDLPLFKKIFSDIFTCNEDLIRLLPQLRKRYKIYALSNTCEMHIDWIEDNFSFLKNFNELVLSYRVGHMKPEEEIFYEVLKRSNLRPGEHFYIDDNLYFKEVAKGLGFQGHHFVSNEALTKDLKIRHIIYQP